MSADKSKLHVLVLPEDRANHEIANGFRGHELNNDRSQRQIQVESVARGWLRTCETYKEDYEPQLRTIGTRHVILLIDLDREQTRIAKVQEYIHDDLKSRVFVLGVWSEPEELKADQRLDFESIGRKLREDCPRQPGGIWGHGLLRHNSHEVERMWSTIGQILSGN